MTVFLYDHHFIGIFVVCSFKGRLILSRVDVPPLSITVEGIWKKEHWGLCDEAWIIFALGKGSITMIDLDGEERTNSGIRFKVCGSTLSLNQEGS